jgi:3-phytase
MMRILLRYAGLCLLGAACRQAPVSTPAGAPPLRPVAVTQPVVHDTDDPAIWVHPEDPAQSLVLGTDKNSDGALYVFDLQGNIVQEKVVRGLRYPNNVDVEYGLMLNGQPADIAVVTERERSMLRIFRLPDLQPLDGGGIPVFEGETGEDWALPMGIALYKRAADSAIFAILSRKHGPETGYLWQYRLSDNGAGGVQAVKVRAFGAFNGKAEIESVAVDDAMGYVYYSDETWGVHQYHADPERGDAELSSFARSGFREDHEGISIYPTGDTTGYILVSDQQAAQFQVFAREGRTHPLLGVIPVSTVESDGSEICPAALGPAFPKGIFVAMSSDKTFQYYAWEQLEQLLQPSPGAR